MGNKKILVVSNNAFSTILNNGKTYESFFSDFPKGSFAQLFFNHNESPDFEFCDNYFKEICNADLLLIVESNDDYYRKMIKLSVSTKIPEYLAAGKPILAIGPSQIASIRYLQECNVGLIIENFTDESKGQILEFISNTKAQIILGANAKGIALKNHEQISQNYFLKQIILKNL